MDIIIIEYVIDPLHACVTALELPSELHPVLNIWFVSFGCNAEQFLSSSLYCCIYKPLLSQIYFTPSIQRSTNCAYSTYVSPIIHSSALLFWSGVAL